MGDHSHINNDTHWLPHILPYIFTPLHQPKTPVFAKNCHPKSYFCHCPEFWKFFTQRPLIGWNLKGTQMPPPFFSFFYDFCHWKTPYFFALHTHVCLRGMLLPQTQSEAGKFCILETESSNLVNTFRCKFNKGDENKISVLQAQPTQLCIIWMNFIGEQGSYTGYYPPSQTRKGIYILQTPSINLHPWLSKQMPSVPEDVRAEAFLSVRCSAGPAEGPGKILKYRSNLRLYPVNFGNKLCILIFIILSIWPNFFDPPPPLLRKTFWSPPFLVTQNFFDPPSILPSPRTKVFMNAP